MACKSQASNYDRKKASLIDANMWKSMFISLWKKYGDFETIDGVEIFGYYRIDGDGEGQHKMSKHLQDKDLWEKTMNDDVADVKLYFNLNKLIEIDAASVQLWVDTQKALVNGSLFDTLTYTIQNHEVVSAGFYKDNALVTDVFYVKLASWVAEKKRLELEEDTLWNGNYGYTQAVTAPFVQSLFVWVASYTDNFGSSDTLIFDITEVEEEIRAFLSVRGIGTNILDELVTKGTINVGNAAGEKIYYLPVDKAKKMSGFVFIELVTQTLDFRVNKKGGFWRTLLRFAKVILAGIALYFQQYWLAASLFVGFIADETGIKALKIVSQGLGLMQGDFTSLSSIGVSEAVSLLVNIYQIYITLEYNPESGVEPSADANSDQYMMYKAPYSAYEDLYCYEKLVAVRVGAVY